MAYAYTPETDHPVVDGAQDFRASRIPLPQRVPGRLWAGPWPSSAQLEYSLITMRALLGPGAGVRCFVSLVSQREVETAAGGVVGPYQELVQQVLDEVAPDAEPVPCAQANVEDSLTGVVRWSTAEKRLGQCATFVVEQLRAGQSVYLHCGDGVGRTGIVTAAVVGILAELGAEQALAVAEEAYVRRRGERTNSSPETDEQRAMAKALLEKLGTAKPEPAAAEAAAARQERAGKLSNAEPEPSAEQPRRGNPAHGLKMTPTANFEFTATPAPAAAAAASDAESSKPEQSAEDDADELARLRKERIAQMQAEKELSKAEAARRFAEYERLLAEDEERKRAIESKGLVIGALPAWAKTAGLGPSPLGGAAEGGRAREGDVVLRPSEQKDDGPTNSWGFD